MSLLGTGLGTLVGVPLGLVAVYMRGWTDDALMRVADALAVLPGVIIAVALAGVMGGSLVTVVAAIAISTVPWIAAWCAARGWWCASRISSPPQWPAGSAICA